MVKAPSSHGLDRKYRPWRRGKSQNSHRRSSLKQQLRGHQRALQRATQEEHRETLREKIRVLEEEIQCKQQAERERKHAKQSHGTRFLERQKLVRMERNVRKNPNLSESQRELQLMKIALDQAYVAHYPLERRYDPLFRHGVRVVDATSQLVKRARIRQRILEEEFAESEQPKSGIKPWISPDQYQRVHAFIIARGVEWSVEHEREYFGELSSTTDRTTNGTMEVKNDNRFKELGKHEELLAAADKAELELDDDDNGVFETTQSDDDELDAKPSNGKNISSRTDASMKKQIKNDTERESSASPMVKRDNEERNTSDDDSTSSDSSSKSSVSSNSDSTTNNSSDSEEDSRTSQSGGNVKEEEERMQDKHNKTDEVVDNNEDDDFLVPIKESQDEMEQLNIFSRPMESIPAIDQVKGDKSKGWATQKQRPSKFKQQQQHQRKRKVGHNR